jgi:hypothetical protein
LASKKIPNSGTIAAVNYCFCLKKENLSKLFNGMSLYIFKLRTLRLRKMNKMIEIGKYNTLTILRYQSWFILVPETDPEGTILLPNKYVPNEFEIGEELLFLFI